MSKLGTHTNQSPTDIRQFLQMTHDAGSFVRALFALDIDISPDIRAVSPTTKLIFRTQQFGADNGAMYQGDPIAAGRAWVDLLLPVLRLNPADWYAIINEPGRSDVEGLTWLCSFYLGAMQRADEVGIKLCIGEWSTGQPPLEDNYISIYTPMLRYAAAHGHILGLHEYSLDGPMIGSPLCLRYRAFHDALPLDARPLFAITEAGPGAGYGTGYTMQEYIDVVADYDAEVMKDDYVIGVALFRLGKGESNMAEVMPLLTQYVIDHPSPVDPPPSPASHSGAFSGIAELTDSTGHTWKLGGNYNPEAGYQVLRDGVQFSGGQAEALLYFDGAIYVTNHSADWYKALADGWQKVSGDPRSTVIDPPPSVKAKGIDVSHYQGVIDWAKVKGAGTAFAFIKCTEGTSFKDNRFAANWNGAKAQGILRGAYHYFHFEFDPVQQANFLLSVLGADRGELPIVVDVEDQSHAAGANTLKLFLDRIEAVTGRKPIIYTGAWWWTPQRWGGTVPAWSKQYDLWIASYTDAPKIPQNWESWKFWQYSNVGMVAGISGDVDLDLFNGTLDELKAYATTAPYPVSKAWRGLQMRADGHSGDADFTCLHVAKLNAAKIMTNTGFDELARLITEGIKPENIVLRLYAAGDNPSLRNSQQFFNEQRDWLTEFKRVGGRYVEIHNEPNHPVEGMGTAWLSAYQFGGWYEGVARKIRQYFPGLKIGWPGLWPDEQSSHDFISAMKASINIGLIDWIGAHSYWGNAAGVDDPENGRWYRRLMGNGKPVIITEFCNNQTLDSDEIKGAQYKHYYATLDQGVLGAFAFVSSASDGNFNTTRLTWVRNGALTVIPSVIGS